MPNARAASPAVAPVSLLLRRAGARAGILLALMITVAAGVGLGAGLGAGGPLATHDVIRDTLPPADVPEGWLQVQTRPSSDREAQADAGTAVLHGILGDDVRIETLTVGGEGTDFERTAWRLSPAASALTPAGMDRLAQNLPRVLTEFRSSDAAEGGAIVTGGLADAVAGVAAAARATYAIFPVPIALLAVLAWFAVLQLSRLLGAFRQREAQLLDARGLSSGQSVVMAAGEGGVVAVLGVIVGAAAAAAVLAAMWPGADGGAAALVELWPVLLAVVVVVAVTIAVAQTTAARSRRAAASGRLAQAASPALAVLLVAVAAVLVWQAATTAADGWDAWTVAVTILAPTVGTAALAVIALVVFGPLAALVAVIASRARGLSPSYPARQVARRMSAFSVAVALVVIAMGGAVLAGAYAATWTSTTQRAAHLSAGAPLRAVIDPVTPADVARAHDAVVAAAPAYTADVVAGDVPARLVALPPAAVSTVVTDLLELARAVQTALTVDNGGEPLPLPDGTTAVGLTGAVTATSPEIAEAAVATARVVDDTGTPGSVPLTLSVSDDRFTAEGVLPDGARPWSLVSIDVARGTAFPTDTVVFTDTSVLTWQGETQTALDATTVPSASLQQAVRSAVVFGAAGTRPERVPAVVTETFAASLGLAPGDDLDLRVEGSGRQYLMTVADVSAALPGIGAGAGVFADLDALVVASAPMATGADVAPIPPAATEVWASGEADAAPALAEALGAPVSTVEDPRSTAAGGLAVLWSIAAIGGAVLAGVALVALLWAAARQRAGEVLVLRALGIPPRVQSRLRSAESGFVVVLAAVLGVAGGACLSFALIPRLVARTIATSTAVPALAIDPLPALVAAGILLGAFALAAAGAAVTVRRQGASTRVEEAAP